MPKFEDTEGFILIGGKSRRMQTDKASVIFQNKTLLQIAHDALLPNCAKISFIANRTQQIENISGNFPHVQILRDTDGKKGVTYAVLNALKNCRASKAFILACDFPLINAETIGRICEISRNSKEFEAVIPLQVKNGKQPLCAVYKISCREIFEKVIAENENSSMRNITEKLKVLEVSEEEFMHKGISPFLNANTPADLRTAENLIFNANQSI